MIPYYDLTPGGGSDLVVSVFSTMRSVETHRHEFQEFVLITKGSCIHRYNNISRPLIPGDVFLIPPHQEHAYIVETPVSMYNCQFFPELISDWWDGQFGDMLDQLANESHQEPVYSADLNHQHIIHLSVTEAKEVRRMLDQIQLEQQNQLYGYRQVKQDYLNLILITIARARMNQGAEDQKGFVSGSGLVRHAQQYIEEHLSDPIRFSDYADNQNVSAGYFRSVFKNATGLSPVDYLNRLRIITAIELFKDKELAISDVAEKVGILDANYFSRLFRKIIGYSPSEFRKRSAKSP